MNKFILFCHKSFRIILTYIFTTLFFYPTVVGREKSDETILNKQISISIAAGSLDEAFEQLRKEAGLSIYYDKNLVTQYHVDEIKFSNKKALTIISKIIEDTGLTCQVSGNSIIIKLQAVATSKSYKNDNPGILEGKILDENREPLPGATIFIVELNVGAVTDFDGGFKLELQPGTYTVEIGYISYQKQQITNVEIKASQVTPLNIAMQPATTDLDEAVVTAEYKRESAVALYALQKQTVSLTDGISAEQIKQLPASNVAQVLKKVSGVTIQDDKYVIVRGMSERYNNVQLNSSSLPSTEPNRRNFSFDIIPSNLVDNVVVHKTFSPELPGEFAGGLVNVNTISIPQKTFLSISGGTGFNTISTGNDFYSTKRQTGDYFGGSNNLIWYNRTFDTDKYFSDYDADEPGENCLEQIANIPNNWGLYKYMSQPKQSYSISFGKPLEINVNNTIGLIVAGTYRHEDKIEDFWERTRKNLGDTTIFGYNYKFKTNLGGIVNMAWKNKNGHAINFRNLYNRNYAHDNPIKEYEDLDNPGLLYYRYYSVIKISTIGQSRLDGKHNIISDNLIFDWFADYNKVNRVEPDTRNSCGTIIEKYNDMNYLLSYDFQGLGINGLSVFANELNESKKNVGGNLTAKFKLLGNEQKIKTGYSGSFRTSDFDQTIFVVSNGSRNLSSLSGLTDVELGNPEYFETGKLVYASITGSSSLGQGYEGTQAIHAVYLMTELSPIKQLGINGGVRIEDETMDVRTLQRYENSGAWGWADSIVTYNETELLPSITLIYKITPDIQFKAAYNKTLTRVDFKERSAFNYYDMEELGFMIGNGGLESGYAKNYDLRLEWYPKPGEIISVSAFYKYFVNPVEKISYDGLDGNYRFMYFNLDDASTKGIEVDLRKSLGFIYKDSKILNHLFVSGNATFMKGKVTYNANKLAYEAQNLDYDEEGDEVDATRNRDLQGLSPMVYNAGVNYQGERLGASVNFNHTGRTLVLAGTKMEGDEYNAQRNHLDAQMSMNFIDKHMTVKFNISDLLADDYISYRNKNPDDVNLNYAQDSKGLDYNPDWDWTLKRINRGTSYSVSVSYKF